MADDAAKAEFKREMELMKTLGTNERIVNMLGCITATEPFCLVTEYCSNGDLLKYLRARCDYMFRVSDLRPRGLGRGLDECF